MKRHVKLDVERVFDRAWATVKRMSAVEAVAKAEGGKRCQLFIRVTTTFPDGPSISSCGSFDWVDHDEAAAWLVLLQSRKNCGYPKRYELIQIAEDPEGRCLFIDCETLAVEYSKPWQEFYFSAGGKASTQAAAPAAGCDKGGASAPPAELCEARP